MTPTEVYDGTIKAALTQIQRYPALARTGRLGVFHREVFEALLRHTPAVISLTRPPTCPRCHIGVLEPPENGHPYLWCVWPQGFGNGGCGVVVSGPIGPWWIWRRRDG